MKSLVVSLHDVSPLTQTLCEEILTEIQELGVRQTSLLVIPNYHGRAPVTENWSFRAWLTEKVEAGHEPVLHGYFHQREGQGTDTWLSKLTTEIYTAGEGEFFDLSTEEAADRMRRGLNDLGFLPRRVVGFIAPAWLLGVGAEIAARQLGFRYTTRVGTVRTFGRSAEIRARSLAWSTRASWRAVTSLGWNRSLAIVMAGAQVIRVGIHPPDIQYPAVWRQIRRIIAEVCQKRDCISYEKFVENISRSTHR